MGLRILLVDDEPNALRALERSLAEDFDVTTAVSSEEAIELIEAGNSFDLIATDVLMPGMSGLRLAKRLQEESPQTPLIVFSNYEANQQRVADLTNVRAFLPKPFSVNDLVAQIHEVIEGKDS